MWREAMGQTWNGDLLHDASNIGADVAGFFAGPPGDPAVIRQTALTIETLRDRYERDRRGLDDAVDELMRTWTGDSASQFSNAWYEGGARQAPAEVLAAATTTLDRFVRQLRDYADELEHAQNEHWIQMAMVVGLTVVNAAQLGADPATDAAEVGVTAMTVAGSSITLADIGAMTIGGAFLGFGSDLVVQLGADGLDLTDGQFDHTADHVVPWLNGGELTQNALEGGASGALFGGVLRLVGGPASVSRASISGGPKWLPAKDDFAAAADAPDRNGFTFAGRALQKHGSRPGSAFPTLGGNPATLNPAGRQIVDNILGDPGAVMRTGSNARVGDYVDIVATDGRGIRYRTDGSFVGFLEPPR